MIATTHAEATTAERSDLDAPSPRFHGQRMTIEQFAALPDDDHRYEYINGEARAMSPAGGRHGWIATRLIILLGESLEESDHLFDSSTGYRLPNGNVLSPDVSVILVGRLLGEEEPVGFITIAPDLAVEIVSPGDLYGYLQQKVAAYLDWGVKAVWVVEPAQRQVMVHTAGQIIRIHGDDILSGGDAVPGFSARLDKIFLPQRAQSLITNP
ncbi:MAG: Uma2 family endonuclease [Caldilineaceae bacterium]|nr:Uma2 family endonuclease [Caldilineaceae bacterium]